MAILWAESADRHGVPHDAAMHAIVHAVYVDEQFDEPRVPGRIRPTLFIGPATAARGAPLLEVMVEVTPPRDLFIFHVMQARPKHLNRMEDRP